MNRVLAGILILATLFTAGSCQPTSQAGTARVVTYNLEWFSEDANPERIKNLKSVIKNVNPDILAVQEVQSRASLQQLFSAEWDIAIKDDPQEDQEVGLVVKKPYKIEDYDTIFKSPTLDEAFPGGRDVLRAIVVAPDGTKLVCYVVHMKSRRGGRNTTDRQREMAAGMLASYIKGQKDENSIVLGDFNDTPDDTSVNILETGNIKAKGGRYPVADPLLVNLTEKLYDEDGITHGLSEIFDGTVRSAIVAGSKEENEKWRGKDYDFRNDTKIHQTLLDQILVSPSLAKKTAPAQVYVGLDALQGEDGRTTKRDDGTTNYIEKGTRASDHLPLYVFLKW